MNIKLLLCISCIIFLVDAIFVYFQDTARRIARVSKEAKLEIDEEEYVTSFKPNMMDVVHAWCKGATFLEICKMTDIFEGLFKNMICCLYVNKLPLMLGC